MPKPIQKNSIDLRKIFPRSPQETLGGYVHLPRMIDKARAKLARTMGEYIWNCPLDQKLLPFLKTTADDFLKAVAKAKNDADVLAWVQAKARNSPARIKKWSDQMRSTRPKTKKEKKWFVQRIAEIAPGRSNLKTYFDLLDADEKRK